jgi:hypothetical protein
MKVTHLACPCPGMPDRICYTSSSDVPVKLKGVGYDDIDEKCCLGCLVWCPCSQEIPNDHRVWQNKGRHILVE